MIPTILLTFANDNDAHLDHLKTESYEVYKALEPLKINNSILIEREESITLDILFERVTLLRNQLSILHYSGHAGSKHLQLEDGQANAKGLIKIIASAPNLELVFLNGCATYQQVEELLEQGVKIVIATRVSVQDVKAMEFAINFYKGLSKQLNIEDAFSQSVAYLETKYHHFKINTKGLKLKKDTPIIPWGLYTNNEEYLKWSLFKEKNYNKKNIFKLLSASFNDEDLQTFCMLNFEKIYENFGMSQSKNQKIMALIDHSKRFLEMDKLLLLLEEENLQQFNKYKPYY